MVVLQHTIKQNKHQGLLGSFPAMVAQHHTQKQHNYYNPILYPIFLKKISTKSKNSKEKKQKSKKYIFDYLRHFQHFKCFFKRIQNSKIYHISSLSMSGGFRAHFEHEQIRRAKA